MLLLQNTIATKLKTIATKLGMPLLQIKDTNMTNTTKLRVHHCYKIKDTIATKMLVNLQKKNC